MLKFLLLNCIFHISWFLSFDLWVKYEPDVFSTALVRFFPSPLTLNLSLSVSVFVSGCFSSSSCGQSFCHCVFFFCLILSCYLLSDALPRLIFTCFSQRCNLSKSISSTHTGPFQRHIWTRCVDIKQSTSCFPKLHQ